jgi:RsiW-degrading membrane proteinase PrsW (M82 family)
VDSLATLVQKNLAGLPVSVLPVIAFLVALIFLDSYKLIRVRSVLFTIFVGIVAAFVCIFANNALSDAFGLDRASYTRYMAPPVEELAKAIYVAYLIWSKKVGFMVDAAICGFAVGAGFAVLENVQLLALLQDSNMFVWVVRGFGTAVMHGGTTALFAIVAKTLHDSFSVSGDRGDVPASGGGGDGVGARIRGTLKGFLAMLPGLLAAVAIHSLYNHFFISPELSAIAIVIGLPLLMVVVFQQSERILQHWLGVGFDTDSQLYEMLTTGRTTETPVGQYLVSVKKRFPAEVVADMLCLLRLHLELSIRAKGMMLMRERGYEAPVDPEIREKFTELKYLERSVGRTGQLTMMPFLRWSSRDLWQLYMLGKK